MKKINEAKNAKKFNATINLVKEEMDSVRRNVGDWNVRWDEKFYNVYCYDLQFLLEDDLYLLQSKYDGIYDLSEGYDDSKRSGAALHRVTLEDYSGEEYHCEFRTVEWKLYNSKLYREFVFYNEGDITYSQYKRNRKDDDRSYDYMARYNINDNNVYMTFANIEDKLSIVLNGRKRCIGINGITIMEDGDTMKIEESKQGMDTYIINLNNLGQVESRVFRCEDDIYVFCNGELISATRRVGTECVDIPSEEIDLEYLNKRMLKYTFSAVSDEEVLGVTNGLKLKLINAIKSIKGDVILDGLSRRMDILLSMINAKNAPVVEEKTKKKNK